MGSVELRVAHTHMSAKYAPPHTTKYNVQNANQVIHLRQRTLTKAQTPSKIPSKRPDIVTPISVKQFQNYSSGYDQALMYAVANSDLLGTSLLL